MMRNICYILIFLTSEISQPLSSDIYVGFIMLQSLSCRRVISNSTNYHWLNTCSTILL